MKKSEVYDIDFQNSKSSPGYSIRPTSIAFRIHFFGNDNEL